MELNLGIVDLIRLEMTLSGYPFLRKKSMIFLISASILLFEKINCARLVKHLTRPVFQSSQNDVLPIQQQNMMAYKFQCRCDADFIGRTFISILQKW